MADGDHGGWIPVDLCTEIVTKPLSFVAAVDGSDVSMVAFHYVTEGIMQKNRETFCEVLHVFDEKKDEYLPLNQRPDALKTLVEAKLAGAVSAKRSKFTFTNKDERPVGDHICDRTKAITADFVIMGYVGRKGKKSKKSLMASNVQQALSTCACAVVVIKDDTPDLLPVKRVAKFVVSVSLNKASTKAFLDALRLSAPGDEIHVVYVKSFMERTDSDYTAELRAKYDSFFAGLQDRAGGFAKFHDRTTQFVMVNKQRRESTAQAVVRYGDEIEADFMCVGTNSLRMDRGKSCLGSVSLDIVREWDRNFIVSHWTDIDPKLYERYGARMSTAA